MPLPQFTESNIRDRASSRSWSRGVGYLEDESVHQVEWRGKACGLLSAQVYGSDYEPYQVHVDFLNSEITSASCSCPYDLGGDCKHIVATLLFVLHTPEEVDERPTVGTLTEPLKHDQLLWLLRTLTEQQPSLIDSVEALVAQINSTSSNDVSSASSPDGSVSTDAAQVIIPPLNEKVLRHQIAADMRGAIETGYDGWGEEA